MIQTFGHYWSDTDKAKYPLEVEGLKKKKCMQQLTQSDVECFLF